MYYGTCMMSELERMVWNAADYLRLYFDYNVPINTLARSNSVPPSDQNVDLYDDKNVFGRKLLHYMHRI